MSAGHSPETAAHTHHELSFLRKYIFSEDHKIIGIQFLFSSLIFLIIGGLLALFVRMQLAWPHADLPGFSMMFNRTNAGRMPPEFYNMLFSMHATVMIFFVIIPLLVGAFGNFLIPLMIGARDMAFPKLNMMSYWFMWPAFIFILISFFAEGGGPAAGWTSYPTLASATMPAESGSFQSPAAPNSGQGQIYWLLALLFVGVSSMMGSVNYLTTIINLRAPGMTLFRMPMTIWAMFITAMLQAFALPVLTVGLLLQTLDKTIGTTFFLPPDGLTFGNWQTGPGGGQTLLWQHLFWFYSHPAVYIMILPAMGFVSDIISTCARRPLFGYRAMIYSIAGIAGLGFIVWGHHMFQSGMDPRLGTGFMIATIMIALPSAVKVFNWLGTVYMGRLQFTTAMLFALSFVALFIIGGLSGIFMAATPVDIFIHDTYFIVAHLHYVLFASSLMGIFAAIYFWFPKMFGRMMNEKWGKVHFVFSFVAGNCVFFPMHILGTAGLRRRIPDFTATAFEEPLMGMNQFMSISAFVLGAAQIIFFINFFYSLFRGPVAGRNPWNSNSLEWTATSPAPHGNWGDEVPVVHRGPYEYSPVDAAQDHLMQTEKLPGEFPSPTDQPAHH
ncbi:MAG: cbb3-type cytochrome c oxidase subunit I [Gemmataceae bacterium]|nr:cbb3-type cytochrome c oxidase subunit I [Gemmataceae bacterium]